MQEKRYMHSQSTDKIEVTKYDRDWKIFTGDELISHVLFHVEFTCKMSYSESIIHFEDNV